MKNNVVVLVTGCSSGVGRELCKVLFEKGYEVIATARSVDALADLPASLKLNLDVTNIESINLVMKEILLKFHKIDILINNAGYSMRGALEEVNVSSVKEMFEVNVFGIINMIQAVVPIMRDGNSGRILNIGSISGKFVQPVNGVYCASKYAVEALSDAMRLELYQYHIQATVIEPGPINTNFFNTMTNNSRDIMSNSNSPYSNFYQTDTSTRKKWNLTDAKKAAEIICKIVIKKRMKSRYKVAVPFAYRLITHFPDSLKEYILKRR